jgi:small-conductance mechanosensitive channel
VGNATVENLSMRTKRRQRFFVQVTYDTPREKVEELVVHIKQLIIDHPLAEESTCQVRFNNFGESSLDILVLFHLQVEDYATELREREVVLLQIMDREGTPQGGPLSPLLSNLVLDELDRELERRGHRFCRYADDCVPRRH